MPVVPYASVRKGMGTAQLARPRGVHTGHAAKSKLNGEHVIVLILHHQKTFFAEIDRTERCL